MVAALGLTPILSAALSFAQAPPPVPALPDTERRTQYSISASTCACSVGFALFGTGSDVDQWIEVWVAGTRYLSTDPAHGWGLTSATGTLATIPRPITDAVLTFTAVQTGTVQIVGAERPRRTAQFAENRGVAARDLNQALTDIIATNRETWDKINDVTGRGFFAPPGSVGGVITGPLTGVISGPLPSTDRALARWNGTSGAALLNSLATLSDIGALTLNPVAGNNSSFTINQTLSGGTGANKNYTSLNIASDNVNCAFCTDYDDTHFFGGPLAAGTRIGAFYYLVQTAATNPAQPGGNSLRVYLGNGSVVQTNTGDGGTGTGEAQALGTYFGNNPVVRNSGTNIYNMFASEMDQMSGAGSSARYSAAGAFVNFEAVQGAAVDAGAVFYSGGSIAATGGGGPWGPGVGFHNGILFAELASNGLVPIDSGGTVLGTYLSSLSNIPVTNGIDLRGFLVSGLAYASTGFSVDGSGNLISRMAAKSIKGNSAGSAGASSDLTVAQTQALLGYPIILGGFLDGINCNATNTDNTITITSPTTNYKILNLTLQNTGSTASLTTATFGVWSGTVASGTNIFAGSSTMTTMTSNSVNGADAETYAPSTISAWNFGTVQFRTQVAQGAACTINAYIYIQPLP